MKVRILPFLTTFAQLSARLKNFLRGWLLVLGIKEGLVECATVCVKSVVILLPTALLAIRNQERRRVYRSLAHYGKLHKIKALLAENLSNAGYISEFAEGARKL